MVVLPAKKCRVACIHTICSGLGAVCDSLLLCALRLRARQFDIQQVSNPLPNAHS